MRRDQQLDDMIEDNRQLSIKLDAALLQLSETRKILAELGRRASAIETKSDKLDLLAWMQDVMEGAEKPKCALTEGDLATLDRVVAEVAKDLNLTIPEKRSSESPKRGWKCAKCGKVSQFQDGLCWDCFGGDPGQ